MQFDERVHLAAIGGGFLRTPYLTSTQDPAAILAPDECPIRSPQIIHVPAAGRRSGLNLPDPTYRRAVFTSDLCKRITRDGAAQANQEAAGITFAFSENPDRNLARARLNPGLSMFTERVLLLDSIAATPPRPFDVNTIMPDEMSTGFLAFISRYWQDLRHVDSELLLKHHIPLQFECDFDVITLSSRNWRAFLPILGNRGRVMVYDSARGPESYDPSGSPVGLYGTVSVISDGIGGYLLDLDMIPSEENAIGITIADESGQVFARRMIIQDGFPAGVVVKMPHGMVGVPYHATIPCLEVLCRLNGQTCASVPSNFSNIRLPAGLHFGVDGATIEGIPTEYGSNYGMTVNAIPQEDFQALGLSLTVNRPPRNLLTITDRSNDKSTGEYYSSQFMPFGSTLVYGGHSYEFRRFMSNTQPWPAVVAAPYTYGVATRQSAKAQEQFWKHVP